MSIYTLQNEYLLVCVNSFGATLTGIYDKQNNKELLWQKSDERSWKNQDVCIFPFVARLKDGVYQVDGKEYEMPIHGLCKLYDFSVKKHSSDCLEMSITFCEDSLKIYPYKFEFTARYELFENNLKVSYVVENLDNKTIYYGIGGHPAFAVDGVTGDNSTDITGNAIVIDGKSEFVRVTMNESNYFVHGEEIYDIPNGKLGLSKELFANDAIILKNNFGSVTLVKKNGGKILFETNSNYLAFWSYAKFGEFVCIEPWWSLPDDENPRRELKEKSKILSLNEGESKEYSYRVTVID